jgi:hypothetical protein
MQNKPDTFFVLAMLAWTALSGYYSYRSWFDVSGLQKSMRRDIEKLPLWYPLRNYSLRKLGATSWLWQVRIFSTFSTFVGVLTVIFTVYSLLR